MHIWSAGQLGHPGHFRALLAAEQVDDVVVVVPDHCRHCQQPFLVTEACRHGRPWRHQVVELLPLTVRVTEYQMQVRRCLDCGCRTRASLPPGVPLRPFGTRLTAVVALLSGRYRLSRREVQHALQDLWGVSVSMGAVVRQEQAQSIALAPVVQEVRAAVRQARVVNMDETGWREVKQRAWLWTAVTPYLTTFLINRSRGGSAIEALLGEQFAGIVGSDRWSAYGRFPAEQRALCYAHLKRDFQALVDRGGTAAPIGRWGLVELERLFALWHRFRAGEFDRKGVAATAGPTPGTDGATAVARRGQCGPESGGAVPWAQQMVGGAVDLRAGGGRRANQQCLRTRPASGRVVAQGKLWLGQRSRQSLCGAAVDGGSILPPARTAAAGLPGGGGGGYDAGNLAPVAASCTTGG